MIKKLFKSLALAATLSVVAVGANAAPIGLGIAIDESGSIGAANFATQKTAYHAALDNIIPLFFGQVALNLVTFDSNSVLHQAMVVINDQTDLDAFTAVVDSLVFTGGGTNIANGINEAAADIAAFGYGNLDRAVIDVSTDGFGGNPIPAANAFVAAAQGGTLLGKGAVNCLGIGAGANCNFETGDNAFEIVNVTFATLQTALETKLKRELGGVPEPGMIALLGLGLLGLGVTRRRKLVA